MILIFNDHLKRHFHPCLLTFSVSRHRGSPAAKRARRVLTAERSKVSAFSLFYPIFIFVSVHRDMMLLRQVADGPTLSFGRTSVTSDQSLHQEEVQDSGAAPIFEWSRSAPCTYLRSEVFTWADGADSLADSTYERLCLVMYTYRFGTMDVLKLVNVFEEILHIEPPQAPHQNTEGEKE